MSIENDIHKSFNKPFKEITFEEFDEYIKVLIRCRARKKGFSSYSYFTGTLGMLVTELVIMFEALESPLGVYTHIPKKGKFKYFLSIEEKHGLIKLGVGKNNLLYVIKGTIILYTTNSIYEAGKEIINLFNDKSYKRNKQGKKRRRKVHSK